ncbi:MAG TPA: hypothetical protein VK179_10805 [Bacteroidales bacterium]|nr:hypothetical protein [Bacteroidales bacterium]
MENVREISKLRFLGRESFMANISKQKATPTKIKVGNHVTSSVGIHTESQVAELEGDVYQAPAGMSGETLKDEIIILKLNNMETMNYFEAKELAKKLNIEGYGTMKKDVLFAKLEEVKAERETLKEEKQKLSTKVPKSTVNKGYTIGQSVTEIAAGKVGQIMELLGRNARVQFGEAVHKLYYKEFAAVTC